MRVRRRSLVDSAVRVEAERGYREARRVFQRAIRDAKNASWGDLLATLEANPWDKPYRIVMGRLRRATPSICETLPNGTVTGIVGALFLTDPDSVGSPAPPRMPVTFDRDEVPPVGEAELEEAFKATKVGKAPGPDGVTGRILRGTAGALMPIWTECFTACLREGFFPPEWNRARLVLLKKPNCAVCVPSHLPTG